MHELAVNAARTYVAAYGESDIARKREMVVSSVSEDGSYCSPSVTLDREGIMGMVADAHTHGRLTITSGIRIHHEYLTFDWLIEDLEGNQMMSGVDFCVLAPDGRLKDIVVFKN